MLFSTGFYLIYLVNTVRQFVQIFAGDKNIIIIRSFYRSCKFFAFQIIRTLINKNDAVGKLSELIFPIAVRKSNTFLITRKIYTACLLQPRVVSDHFVKRCFACAAVTANYSDVSVKIKLKNSISVFYFDMMCSCHNYLTQILRLRQPTQPY